MPAGRPSDYKPEYAELAKHLYALGATDKQVANAFHVSEQTINTWKKKHPKFLESLKAKEDPDDLVEKSLFQSAIDGSNTAQIFWLKNRRPTQWRDKRDYSIDGNMNLSPWEKFHAQENEQSGRAGSGDDTETDAEN